ncbi:MAG: hypothetical protein K6G49_00940 [Candidatus Saccharibacteria bacterium]|nr:hypothetical protein [Candidatus Saccharibacteria bacterium]
MELVILSVIVVALLIIIVVLVAIAAALYSKSKRNEEALEIVIDKSIEKAFKREERKIAKMYTEERRLAKWVDKILKADKIDLTKIATETEQRAYLLALKKTEDAVLSAEQGLDNIRQEILKAQKEAIGKAHIQAQGPYKHQKEVLHRLYAQEKVAEKRVKSARKRLTLLTSNISTTELEDALESLDVAPAMVPDSISDPNSLAFPAEEAESDVALEVKEFAPVEMLPDLEAAEPQPDHVPPSTF